MTPAGAVLAPAVVKLLPDLPVVPAATGARRVRTTRKAPVQRNEALGVGAGFGPADAVGRCFDRNQ